MERLRSKDSQLTRELRNMFDLLENQLEQAECDWQWMPVQVALAL